MSNAAPPPFDRYVHEMDARELRIALHDMTLVVAHLVVLAGGCVSIAAFDAPEISGGWVAVKHNKDGSMTLKYCATRAEIEAETADAARRVVN